MAFFSFPEDAEWNPQAQAVEFSVTIGGYEGKVRTPARVLRRLLGAPTTPENCLETYHLHRTQFEGAVEAKLSRKELAEDGNVELTGRDLSRLRLEWGSQD